MLQTWDWFYLFYEILSFKSFRLTIVMSKIVSKHKRSWDILLLNEFSWKTLDRSWSGSSLHASKCKSDAFVCVFGFISHSQTWIVGFLLFQYLIFLLRSKYFSFRYKSLENKQYDYLLSRNWCNIRCFYLVDTIIIIIYFLMMVSFSCKQCNLNYQWVLRMIAK